MAHRSSVTAGPFPSQAGPSTGEDWADDFDMELLDDHAPLVRAAQASSEPQPGTSRSVFSGLTGHGSSPAPSSNPGTSFSPHAAASQSTGEDWADDFDMSPFVFSRLAGHGGPPAPSSNPGTPFSPYAAASHMMMQAQASQSGPLGLQERMPIADVRAASVRQNADSTSQASDTTSQASDTTGFSIPTITLSNLPLVQRNKLLAISAHSLVLSRFDRKGLGPDNKLRPGSPSSVARWNRTLPHVADVFRKADEASRRGDPQIYKSAMHQGAGNCGQLSGCVVDIINKSNFAAHQYQVDRLGTHAFALIGNPPQGGGDTKGFSDYTDCWVSDPWADIVCPAPEYTDRFLERMQDWERKGRLIREGNDWKLPTDDNWMTRVCYGNKEPFYPASRMPSDVDPVFDIDPAYLWAELLFNLQEQQPGPSLPVGPLTPDMRFFDNAASSPGPEFEDSFLLHQNFAHLYQSPSDDLALENIEPSLIATAQNMFEEDVPQLADDYLARRALFLQAPTLSLAADLIDTLQDARNAGDTELLSTAVGD
ncbi:hypothetical protein, partial [Brucella anthropi]|uniref:hypothetical protein n=1 Tax=Brucella anthropi TaxID=529 RepID=UPI00384DFB9F